MAYSDISSVNAVASKSNLTYTGVSTNINGPGITQGANDIGSTNGVASIGNGRTIRAGSDSVSSGPATGVQDTSQTINGTPSVPISGNYISQSPSKATSGYGMSSLF